MSKLKIVERKSEKSINFEREILSKLHNPFIVNMYYAFQDKDNLYLVMDYLKGGDLRFHLTRHIKFSEEQSRFFICNIITSLEYIHSKNIIHRDIKPENLVLEEEGYVRLTDFGIAKKNKDENKGDTSGTPGYMAPEVMKGASHSFEVDFFAIGIIGYEFMKGKRPYCGKSRREIREEMLMRQICLKDEEVEEGWTKESVDFINKLLIRKKENRLGFKGIIELKQHPWIKYYPWYMIVDKSLPSPFVPQNKDNFDLRYCARSEKIGEETKLRYEEILMDKNYQNIFKEFFFNFDYEQRLQQKNKEKNNNLNFNKNIINNKNYYKTHRGNIALNPLNFFINKRISYKQLHGSQNKIVIDNIKDKYNTINDMNANKKLDNDNLEENLYITIIKKENLKNLHKIYENKLKNVNNMTNNKQLKNYKSNSNIIDNYNTNKSLNNKVGRRAINISNVISPVMSDKYLLKNKDENLSKKVFKSYKQKSCIFNTKSDINNLSNRSPLLNSKRGFNKKPMSQNLNKYVTLLSKSNSYRIKNVSKSKNKTIKKIIYSQNNNHSTKIYYNITNNLIPSHLKSKNILEKKKYYNGLFSKINNKDKNNDIYESLLYMKDGRYMIKSKSIIYSNDNIIIKNKINKTSNNNNNGSINKTNNSINKTFLKDLKVKEMKKSSSRKSNEELFYSEINNSCKKRIIINNKRLNINESIRNLIRYNSKYLSLKDLNLNRSNNLIKSNEINSNNNDKQNNKSTNKENINLSNNNYNNNCKKRKVIKNDGSKKIIFVNKRAKNKTIAFDIEKTKYIFNNNSINGVKNPFNNKNFKNKSNFYTLNNNNNSFKSSKIQKEKEKDDFLTYRNIVLSYRQKRNLIKIDGK